MMKETIAEIIRLYEMNECNPTWCPPEARIFPTDDSKCRECIAERIHRAYVADGCISPEDAMRLKNEANAAYRASIGEVWYWQGNGDDLESLTCPVLIEADDLRALLANHRANWVQKAENQDLPLCEPRSDHDHKGGTVCNCRECRIVKAVQQDMITDGWVKVVKP